MQCLPNLDYLLVYGIFQQKVYDLDNIGYDIIDLGKSTSIFKFQYSVRIKDIEYATVLFEPHSSILATDSGMIKISNWVLYSEHMRDIILDIFTSLAFSFVRVSRLDICIDFTEFNHSLHPHSLIDLYFKREVFREGRGKFKAIGTTTSQPTYEYLKFGSNYSDICSYLYNKSLEMLQVKSKDWITKKWFNSGWNGIDEVWRLEFSIKQKSIQFVDIDTGEQLPLSLDNVFSLSFINNMVKALSDKYFNFYTIIEREKGTYFVKDKVPISLLTLEHSGIVKPLHIATLDGSKANKLMISRLYKLHTEMKNNKAVNKLFDSGLFLEILQDIGLEDWAKITNKLDVNH
jgi:hypothetical protein